MFPKWSESSTIQQKRRLAGEEDTLSYSPNAVSLSSLSESSIILARHGVFFGSESLGDQHLHVHDIHRRLRRRIFFHLQLQGFNRISYFVTLTWKRQVGTTGRLGRALYKGQTFFWGHGAEVIFVNPTAIRRLHSVTWTRKNLLV